MKQALGWLIALLFCSSTTIAQTVLQTGDLAIVSFNADGTDVTGILTMVDLLPGTVFLATDNGFERSAPPGAYTFGNSEEVMEFTVGAATIPAGTVLEYDRGFVGGGITALKLFGNFSPHFDQYVTSGDGVFLLQGTWSNGSNGAHDATFSGTYIWGFNGEPWVPTTSNATGTAASRLPPELACASFALPHVDNWTYLDTAPKTGSKATLFSEITNPANWTSSNSGPLPVPSGPFTITPGNTVATWTGNMDTDWFNCQNWNTFIVPELTTDVIFPTTSSANNCVLQPGDTARCRNITFTETGGNSLIAESDPSKVLEVYGDLAIATTGGSNCMDFGDAIAGNADGHVYLHGNWDNQASSAEFTEGDSKVWFVGNGNQSIAVAPQNTEDFTNLEIDKATGQVNLQDNIEVNGNLVLQSGIIATGTNHVYVSNPTPTAITTNGATPISWVFGNLRREMSQLGGQFPFPVGTATHAQLAVLDMLPSHGVVILEASFSDAITGAQPNVNELGDIYPILLNGGIWDIAPVSGSLANTYSIGLFEQDYSNGGGPLINVKRPNVSSNWDNPGLHVTYNEAAGVAYCARTGLTTFSDFGIATRVLPVVMTYFQGEAVEDRTVRLDWGIATEINVETYEVERVVEDGFESIGASAATGTGEYTVYDADAMAGRNEYRLLERTTNGDRIEIGRTEVYLDEKASSWTVYPNPFTNLIQIKHQGIESEIRVSLTALDGRAVLAMQGEITEVNAKLDEVAGNLPAGVYLITITSELNRSVQKLIKR